MIEIDKLSLNGMKKLLACAELSSRAIISQVNDEIIVFAGKDADIDNILDACLYLHQKNSNYDVKYIKNYNEHSLNNADKNIILIATNGISFMTLQDSNKKFLIIDIGSKNACDYVAEGVKKYKKFNIEHKPSYSTYTKKRNPIKLLFKDTQTIRECLSLVLEPSISNIRVQKESISLLRDLTDEEISHWQQSILLDIDLLEKQRALTFKLARVIYIIATLNDYVSDEEVYSFYHKYLGVLKYNNAYKEFWEVSNVR